MRPYQFLQLILNTHAQTLSTLNELLGAPVLFEVLEVAGERESAQKDKAEEYTKFLRRPTLWILEKESTLGPSDVDPYEAIQATVSGAKLSPELQFHLWAFWYYRRWIEAELRLQARWSGSREQTESLATEVSEFSERWVINLKLPPAMHAQALKAIQPPWLKFRQQLMALAGHSGLRMMR